MKPVIADSQFLLSAPMMGNGILFFSIGPPMSVALRQRDTLALWHLYLMFCSGIVLGVG